MNTPLLLVTVIAAAVVVAPPRASPSRGRTPTTLAQLHALTDFQALFRLSVPESIAIHAALKLPEYIVTSERDTMESETALLLLLAYLGDIRVASLARLFGRSEAACSRVCITTIDILQSTWGHLLDISRAHTGLLQPARLRRYADALAAHSGGSPLQGLWGFIDGTVRPIARPSRGQRNVYSGHKRIHGHKYQVVTAPDGLVWIYGPTEARRNDSFVLADSKLHDWLNEHSVDEQGDLFLFGDKGYAAKDHLVVPHKGLYLSPAQLAFNLEMSRFRITVEWAIGSVPTLFPLLEHKRLQRSLHNDLSAQYAVACILRNALSCVSGNQTSQTFGCPTPSLSEYFVPL